MNTSCFAKANVIHTFTRKQKDRSGKKETNSDESIMDALGDTYDGIEDRTDWNVYCIDPHQSTDFDDAFGIKLHYDEELGCVVTKLSIYISNVSILLDHLGLWKSFSTRVSTIYLPDRKRPMLPTIYQMGYVVWWKIQLDMHLC